jgi:hypothetical protein
MAKYASNALGGAFALMAFAALYGLVRLGQWAWVALTSPAAP